MRFEITRTTASTPPCPEATRASLPCWDIRTFKSPEEFDARNLPLGPWLSVGTEHDTIGEDRIVRRLGDREGWVIDLPSLEALIEFVGRYGDVVIEQRFRAPARIEIYDGYRE